MRTRLCTTLLLVLMSIPAAAQTRSPARESGGTPNALQGFSKNKGQPVSIEAERLEVRDKDKTATFAGKVQVVQGDTTLRCTTLTVFYADPSGAKADDGKPVAKIPSS